MSATKEKVSDLIKANNDQIMASFRSCSSILRVLTRLRQNYRWKRSRNWNFKNHTSLKVKLTKTSTNSVLNLRRPSTAPSPPSAPEKNNFEKVKFDLKECAKFLVERQKTDSSCWQVWIRLEYGRRMQTTRSCRWFGRRKRHPQCWETCPYSSRSSVMAATKRSSPLRESVLSSSSQLSFQPGTANSGFLSLCPNIDSCFAFGKPERWHACCQRWLSNSAFQLQSDHMSRIY